MVNSFSARVAVAAEAIRGIFPQTPLQENDYLSKKTGARVLLKREDLSPVRSYKIRGAFNFFRKTLAAGNRAELFVCASAGNHAQGFAYVCRHFEKRGVVFMPVTTPQQKIDKTRLFGGEFVEIRLVGDFFDDCYRALGAIHTTWSMVPGRFKDYISTPKQNDYRSIHTTIVGPSRQRVELQIRTREMNKIAEYGVAAHSIYKDSGGKANGAGHAISKETNAYAWLRRTIEQLAVSVRAAIDG